jgi:hypothetical protein
MSIPNLSSAWKNFDTSTFQSTIKANSKLALEAHKFILKSAFLGLIGFAAYELLLPQAYQNKITNTILHIETVLSTTASRCANRLLGGNL